MASNIDPPNSASVWDYTTSVPPYTLSSKNMSSYLSPKDFYEAGLGSMPDDAMRSTPEERVRMAREIRRAALDELFREMYAQDVQTWDKCVRTVVRRAEKSDDAWVQETIELVLREKEMVSERISLWWWTRELTSVM